MFKKARKRSGNTGDNIITILLKRSRMALLTLTMHVTETEPQFNYEAKRKRVFVKFQESTMIDHESLRNSSVISSTF